MRLLTAGLVLMIVGTSMAACSSDDGDDASSDGDEPAPTTVDRPGGPAATLAPLDGGKGVFLGTSGTGPAVEEAGSDEAEYSAAGAAVAYTSAAPRPAAGTSGAGPALAKAGYDEAEASSAGTAVAYTPEGPLPADGTFDRAPGDEADYETRIVVRRPADPSDFNGTVVVEWLNVSGGVDA